MFEHSLRSALRLAAALGLSAVALPSVAADAVPATGLCSYYKPLDPAVMAKVYDLALTPGAKLDWSVLAKDPAVLAALQSKAAQDKAFAAQDWGQLCRYKVENAEARNRPHPRVVFLGDSITENWLHGDPGLFSAKVLDRGISGQTTSQILLRFEDDVVALHPDVVHIMAGTNDVAENTGPISDEDILANIGAMIDIAQAHHIHVVLASIPPMGKVAWRPSIQAPGARIERLNAALKRVAAERHLVFVDYHTALKDADGGFRTALANDGVHPNRDGYALMRPLTERALAQAEGK
jgi:lysophospholipase L1-like esterase